MTGWRPVRSGRSADLTTGRAGRYSPPIHNRPLTACAQLALAAGLLSGGLSSPTSIRPVARAEGPHSAAAPTGEAVTLLGLPSGVPAPPTGLVADHDQLAEPLATMDTAVAGPEETVVEGGPGVGSEGTQPAVAPEVVGRATTAAAAARGRRLPDLRWPAEGALTGWFGERRNRSVHPGVDIDGATGDPVRAAGAGVVVLAGPAPAGFGGYGTMVMIDHGGGLETLYAHLSTLHVAPGAAVAADDEIGAIGSTGRSTGSHLHFETRLAGVAVDPADWLPSTRSAAR